MSRIQDHDRLATWRGLIHQPTHCGFARNSLCGDEVWIDVTLLAATVQQIRFRGQGCVVSQACASMLCEGVNGKTIDEIRNAIPDDLMDFSVRDLTTNRRRCALLGYEALILALAKSSI